MPGLNNRQQSLSFLDSYTVDLSECPDRAKERHNRLMAEFDTLLTFLWYSFRVKIM